MITLLLIIGVNVAVILVGMGGISNGKKIHQLQKDVYDLQLAVDALLGKLGSVK